MPLSQKISLQAISSSLHLVRGTRGGMEGQLQPHMHEFLLKRAKDVDLKGKNVAVIALGDERYYYTARAGDHLR